MIRLPSGHPMAIAMRTTRQRMPPDRLQGEAAAVALVLICWRVPAMATWTHIPAEA